MPAVTTSGRALAVGLMISSCLLAGCGAAKNPYALPEYKAQAASPTGSGVPRARASQSDDVVRVATPSPEVHYRPGDALGQGAWVERGRITARTATQRAVVRGMTKYLSVRVQLANTWTVDEAALAASATGQARSSAQAWATEQRQRGRRSVGRFIINVSSVRVDGDSATVTGCHFDATSEVDRDGHVLIAPPGGVLITMQLRRVRNAWLAVDWPKKPVPSCDWRK